MYMKKLCDEIGVPGFMLDGAIDLCRIALKEKGIKRSKGHVQYSRYNVQTNGKLKTWEHKGLEESRPSLLSGLNGSICHKTRELVGSIIISRVNA